MHGETLKFSKTLPLIYYLHFVSVVVSYNSHPSASKNPINDTNVVPCLTS